MPKTKGSARIRKPKTKKPSKEAIERAEYERTRMLFTTWLMARRHLSMTPSRIEFLFDASQGRRAEENSIDVNALNPLDFALLAMADAFVAGRSTR